MVVGNGLIANLFKNHDRKQVVFFASGVSNSLETNILNFKREEDLVRKTVVENPEKLFVYFSTCSIYDSSKVDSLYVLHKLNMESIVSKSARKFLILRVSNAVGKGGNPNILLNFLYDALKNDKTIQVHQKATRNLIDSDDIQQITLSLIDQKKQNSIINLAYLFEFGIQEIIEMMSALLNIRPQMELTDSGNFYQISITDIQDYFETKKLTDKKEYLRDMIKKYYL